jgi:HAD superfamily hydrolase (TIGR01509 family)
VTTLAAVIRAVLFDWGDTLVGYEWNDEVALEGTRAGLAALAREGLPAPDAIGAYVDEHLAEFFATDSENEVDYAALLSGCFSELGCKLEDDDVRLYIQAATDVWLGRYHFMHGSSHALLDSLRARGLKVGLVSNTANPLWVLRGVLERQGLLERLDAIALSSEVGKRKPHPDIFRRALDELDVSPGEVLFVGDRLYEDMRGAGELGMTTVQALWFRADEHDNGREPDFRAFTPVDVLNVVRRLNREASPARA